MTEMLKNSYFAPQAAEFECRENDRGTGVCTFILTCIYPYITPEELVL
jgi:hypothetical protein